MNEPRVDPGTLRQTGPAIWAFSRLAGAVTGTSAPNVFTTLGRHRGLFWGWLHFAGKLMPGGTLPRRESEMLILRVAHLRGCAYEFEHHRRLGRRAGLTSAQIQSLTGPIGEPWPERAQTLLRTADALVTSKDLDDREWAALRSHVNDKTAIEVVMLVGHYDMLATALTTLRVQPDRASRLWKVVRRRSA